jgi:hypothetical protein
VRIETVIGAARREIAGRYEIIPDVFPDRGSIIGQAREVDTGQRVWLRAVPRARLHVRGLEGRMERALERARRCGTGTSCRSLHTARRKA